MKISELFLREEDIQHQTRVSSGKLVIDLSLQELPVGDLRTRIIRNIQFVFPKSKVYIEHEVVSTIIDNITQSHFHELHDIYHNVISTLEDTVGDKHGEPLEYGQYTLVFDGVPSFQVDAQKVTINCMDNTIGLTGLDKVIGPNVEELSIRDFQKIKGNILSLAKLKVPDLWIESRRAGDIHHQIENMLEKYRPSQDVIGFQRELIERDMDEYAEF